MAGIVDDRGAVVEEVHHEMNKVCTGLAFLWLELIERDLRPVQGCSHQ